MTVGSSSEVESEFADFPLVAAELGLGRSDVPIPRRRWLNVPSGGHISGVLYGIGSPEIALIPDEGDDGRSLEPLALHLNRSVLALDPAGTGRSSGPATSLIRSGRPLAEAIDSFAPSTAVIVGVGRGGLRAIPTARRVRSHADVILVDALPGVDGEAVNADGQLWAQLEDLTVTLVVTSDSAIGDPQLAALAARVPAATVLRADDTAALATVIATVLASN